MTLEGVGVHSGAGVLLRVRPGNEGIVFHRLDTGGRIAASWRNVAATRLATVVGEGPCAVRTVEHLMSALSALNVWQAIVEVDGEEVPIMDGSAAPFLDALAGAIEPTGEETGGVRVLRPVSAEGRGGFAALVPFEGRRFDVGIDFPDAAIGVQRVTLDLSANRFRREIAAARTFGRLSDVGWLRRRGYARGASLDNAVAVDGARVVNPGGLRFPDEFVRHKLLDAVGDLALAGRPILGLYRAHKAGHRLNYALLARLFADSRNFQIVALLV